MAEYKDAIEFEHTNGEVYIFRTERNTLSNNQMWWFEPLPAMYAGTVKEARSIAKKIRESGREV